MLLVDNFRVLMLIGLICASGIGPSQADPKCLNRNGTIVDCANESKGNNCGVYVPKKDAKEPFIGTVSCVSSADCAKPIPDKITCNKPHAGICCCLSAGPDPCNDLGNDEILKEVCAIDELKELKECKNFSLSGSGDSPTSPTISTGILLMMMSLGAFRISG